MTRSMYDCAVPQPPGIGPTFDCVAGYIGAPGATPHVWTKDDWDSQKSRYRLPIYVPSWWAGKGWNAAADIAQARDALNAIGAPPGCAIGLDMETEVNGMYTTMFVQGMYVNDHPVMTYGSTGSAANPTVFRNATGIGYWAADPTGSPHMFSHPNVVATQYGQRQGGGLDYDLSVLSEIVPLWDTYYGTDDMTPDQANELTNLYAGFFHGGPSCGPAVPGAAAGTSGNSPFDNFAYMRILLETIAARTQPIDAAALAAAIASHMTVTETLTADGIAQAVLMHLSRVTANG